MSDDQLKHIQLNGIVDYIAALDTLCNLAQRNLYLFEKDFDGLGYNTEARYTTLRNFLLANPAHRLFVLAHDSHYLSTLCPRMMLLLQQFGTSMFIHQTPKNLQHISEPFSVADETNYVRRFHFDDPRGILAQHDPEKALVLKSRFLEMWASSRQAISSIKLGL
jgi:hypothetical protein